MRAWKQDIAKFRSSSFLLNKPPLRTADFLIGNGLSFRALLYSISGILRRFLRTSYLTLLRILLYCQS